MLIRTIGVGHSRLDHLWRVAHLMHLPRKRRCAVGIDSETDVLAFGNIAISFVDVGVHFHLGQIVGDGE